MVGYDQLHGNLVAGDWMGEDATKVTRGGWESQSYVKECKT